jgi:hypothetical protein
MHLLSLVITYYPSYEQGLYSTGLVTKGETQQHQVSWFPSTIESREKLPMNGALVTLGSYWLAVFWTP